MVMNRSAPTATIVPILIYEDVGQAIDWLCRAFGFTERLRAERGGVIGHAQLAVAEGANMLGQGGPFRVPQGDEVTVYVHVTVDDVDRHFDRAKQNGAHELAAEQAVAAGEWLGRAELTRNDGNAARSLPAVAEDEGGLSGRP